MVIEGTKKNNLHFKDLEEAEKSYEMKEEERGLDNSVQEEKNEDALLHLYLSFIRFVRFNQGRTHIEIREFEHLLGWRWKSQKKTTDEGDVLWMK